jgi:hypothetical protein
VANGDNQITLTWTDTADPVSYYLVSYGLSSGQYIYGNPNVGGQGTTSYTIGNLANGTIYYFVVRAISGCTPGSFSNEVSAETTGGIVVVTPTPVPTDTLVNTSNQDEITPTDTPPTQNVQPSATPSPKQTLVAGISKTTILIYIIVFILVVGGISWFISWKHQKNMQNLDKPKEEIPTDFINK